MSFSLGCPCLHQLWVHSEMATCGASAFPASSAITGGAQEMRNKVFLLPVCLFVGGCLFQGPCSISVAKLAYVFTPGVSAYSGMLHLPSKAWTGPLL